MEWNGIECLGKIAAAAAAGFVERKELKDIFFV